MSALKNSDILTATSIIAGDIARFPLVKKDVNGDIIHDEDINDAEIIEAALEEFKKTAYVEIAMGEAVQKVDDLEKISQETAKTAKTAQTAAGLAKVSAERTQKMINLQTIHVLTSGGKIDPDIYKGMLELIEPAKKGEYKEHDIFTVVDADKDTDGVAGEGNLVFVYVNDMSLKILIAIVKLPKKLSIVTKSV
ncbi:hypothetical protein CBG03_00985 [Streptococcus pyogenes]|nr:hypothetical protein CBG03_00985 [Streptococcus pyogenes]